MEIGRTVVAGAMGLALLVGTGCGAIAEKATEKAIEQSSGCTDVDIDADGGVSADCEEGQFDIGVGGGAALPSDWPAELAPPSDATIATAFSDGREMHVSAGLDGDLDAVAGGIKAQLEAAGYTIENEATSDVGGQRSATLSAEGPDFRATVVVSDVANATEGNLTIVYSLSATSG